MSVHPLACVHPTAMLGPDVQIGPFCVVEAGVTIGDGCILENRVVIKQGTTLGKENRVFEGVVVGGLPQHAHMPERPGGVLIGSGNTIRENVTVHRAMHAGELTTIGDNNLLMVAAHVAHDCQLGSNTIITNNVMLAGHVTVANRAYLSGAVAVHQFCRVGTMAMVGGQAHINRDVPPYVTVDGLSSLVVGLNQVGLRRAGLDADTIRELKAAYRVIYRSGLTWSEMLKRLKVRFVEGHAAEFYRFCSATERGITPERRLPPDATIKLRRDTEPESQPQVKVG
ncbi:MAG: acyl-ACP--UDP-N-acetylglucosamine O-acyltransferase [Pirellulales bacterium]|nr:acyl-ACP--UDP-N-acetylglucosamine O-acyltransferase [Pirellulales bacterium]